MVSTHVRSGSLGRQLRAEMGMHMVRMGHCNVRIIQGLNIGFCARGTIGGNRLNPNRSWGPEL